MHWRFCIRFIWGLAAVCTFAIGLTAKEDDRRFALIIANQAYSEKVGRLHNPYKDAQLMHNALMDAGFPAENISIVRDTSRVELLSAIERYAQRLSRAGDDAVGFFYYSGHGGAKPNTDQNYLIPVSVHDALSAELWYSAVALDRVRELLQEHAPRAAHIVVFDACRNELQSGDRGGKGFVAVRDWGGMLIAYSTEPGKTASDGERNAPAGPYAQVLAAELEAAKGISAPDLFARVRIAMRGRPERQSPWFLHGLDRHVHFGTSAPLSEVAMVWANVKDSEHNSVLKEFQKQFGADNPVYDRLAALRIEELERKAAPPEPEAEAGLIEPETPEPETKEPEKENPADYVIAMQRELKRVGCYSGRIDGDWGRQSEAALGRVVASKSLTFPEPVVSSVNLDALRKIENGVCKPLKPSAPRPSVRNDPPAASRTERSASVKTKTTSTLSVCYQRAQRYCANPDNSSAIGYQACMTQAKKGCRE